MKYFFRNYELTRIRQTSGGELNMGENSKDEPIKKVKISTFIRVIIIFL